MTAKKRTAKSPAQLLADEVREAMESAFLHSDRGMTEAEALDAAIEGAEEALDSWRMRRSELTGDEP